MYVRASFTSLYEAETQAAVMRNNRRAHSRKNTGELAEIIIDLKGRKVVCLVRNISEGGAMIESSVPELPKRVILNYKAQNIRKVCKVVWSTGSLAGLQFI